MRVARNLKTNLSPNERARRLKAGEDRRAQSRAKLVEAAHRLFAHHGAEAPTIDDVIAEAKVARGTFYNHFRSREELFRVVADEVATDINALILPAIETIDDPVIRIAHAFRMFVRFASEVQSRGWILLRTLPLVGPLSVEAREFVNNEFTAALASGRLADIPLSIAEDLGLGLQITTIHRMLVGGAAPAHIELAAEHLLTALGLSRDEARTIAHLPISGADMETLAPRRRVDARR